MEIERGRHKKTEILEVRERDTSTERKREWEKDTNRKRERKGGRGGKVLYFLQEKCYCTAIEY